MPTIPQRPLLPTLGGIWPACIAAVVSGPWLVQAAPHARHLSKRDGSNGVIRWIPLIVVVAVVFVLAVGYKFRKRIASAVSPASRGLSSAARGAARYLTAAELAASEAASPTTTTAPVITSRATGRPRRQRRTPSQISTRSLPVYNKEPGDAELVVFQGNEELQDEPAAVLRPVDESDGDISAEMPRSTTFLVPLPARSESPYDNEHPSTQQLLSTDSEPATNAHASVEPDPRGEAPPYAPPESMHARQLSTTTDSHGVSSVSDHDTVEGLGIGQAPGDQSTISRRVSGLRSFFSSFAPTARITPAHSRATTISAPSPPSPSAPTNTSPPPSSPPSQIRSHRPSHSGGSGSAFAVGSSAFRTMSRTRSRSQHTLSSANPLSSPSLISLNSISAPLTHTTVRTQFMYPTSGPSADQMKLIASRESLNLFAVPYGPDAVAHASRQSRLELEPPPEHDFGDAAGASTSENANRNSTASSSSGSGSGVSVNATSPAQLPDQGAPAVEQVQTTAEEPTSYPPPVQVLVEAPDSPDPGEEPLEQESTSEVPPPAAVPLASEQHPSQSSAASAPALPLQLEAPTLASVEPASSSEPEPSPAPSAPAPESTPSASPVTSPPTSFKSISHPQFGTLRSQASSVASFATALDETASETDNAEVFSIATAEEFEDDNDNGSNAPTPRHSTAHFHDRIAVS